MAEWGKTLVGAVLAAALAALVTAGSYGERVNTNGAAINALKTAMIAGDARLEQKIDNNRSAIHAGEVERGRIQVTLAVATENLKNARVVLSSLRDRLLDARRQ